MRFPAFYLSDDFERGLATIAFGRIAGEFLVGKIGIVVKRAGGFDDIDALAVSGDFFWILENKHQPPSVLDQIHIPEFD